MSSADPIRIFVAMPGSTMGEGASWDDIPEIKSRLLQPVAERVAARMLRPAALVIEKDKIASGGIYGSMYGEAVDADVYIADLTSANPNVFLELGVRWALRDNVTIPIAQDVGGLRFNVVAARVIQYGPMPSDLERAIEQIADSAVSGLQDPSRVDSPVREGISLVTMPRRELEALEAELRRLRDERGEDLVAAARTTDEPARKIELLQAAIERNPASAQARIQLGEELRKAGAYPDAIEHLRIATRLEPEAAAAWRELGVALGQNEQAEPAVEALERAVGLEPRVDETWSNLGGALRRLARSHGDRETLKRAYDAYARAGELSGNDTYPLMNAARIRLQLSEPDSAEREQALAEFADLRLLAEYAVRASSGEDPWKLIDCADARVLTGHPDEALDAARDATQLIPPDNRASLLSSAVQPLEDLLAAGLDGERADGVGRLIEVYRTAAQAVGEDASAAA